MGTAGKLRALRKGWSIGRREELPSVPAETAAGEWLHTLGWLSAGAGALGLGLVVGRELRQRYKFKRRTPYDVYAHAGDYRSDPEFGVGV